MHEVHSDLDSRDKGVLRKMGCKSTSWPEVILKVFKVDVTGDTEAVHPLTFCHRCWMAAIRGGGVCSFSRMIVPEWEPHSSLCTLCFPKKCSFQRTGRKRRRSIPRVQSLAKRSRWEHVKSIPVGERKVLRPFGNRQHSFILRGWKRPSIQREQWLNISHCTKDHLSTDLISGKLPVDFLYSFTCLVCAHLLSDPLQLPCGHLFCRSCIQKYTCVVGSHCPACKLPCDPSALISPDKAFLSALYSLPLLCPREGCGEQVRLESFHKHIKDHDLRVTDKEIQLSEINNNLLASKGGRPRQHLLSLTRRAQKHRLRNLKNHVRIFADKEEGGDLKSVCMTLLLLALRSGNEHRQADELEAMIQGKWFLWSLFNLCVYPSPPGAKNTNK